MNTTLQCGACGATCSGEQIRVRSALDQTGGTFATCTGCGSLRVLDRIDYKHLYATRSSSNYPAAGNRVFIFLKQRYLRNAAQALLAGLNTSAANILDYGCGGGEFANALHGLGAKAVYACDMQLEHPQTLAPGIHYFALAAIAESGPMDIIVLRHVLEHVEFPQTTLLQLAGMLSPGGQMLIEVPHLRSIFRSLLGSRWPGYFFPFHVHVFSEQGISALAGRCGLRVTHVVRCNTPIFGAFLMGWGIDRSLARVLSILFYPAQCLLNQLSDRQEALRVTLHKR